MRVLLLTLWVARGRRTNGGTRGAVGAEVRVCAPPSAADLPPRAAELVAARRWD
jgi:hypothetical protein